MDLTSRERDEGLTHDGDAFFHRKKFRNFVMTEDQYLHNARVALPDEASGLLH